MIARRGEDRRSCHNVSLLLGLALAARRHEEAAAMFALMLHLVTPVRGQRPN